MDKEKRAANFTKTETDLLIDVTLKYKNIIENKRTNATTWKDKNEAWEQICNEFNAASGNFPRSIKTIRSKYETIKKNIRKKCSLLKSEQTKTGGGQCEMTLTPCEEKILSLTSNTMVGLESRFDNDSEAGTSGLRQWMTQQNIDESNPCIMEEDIEFIDDGDDTFPRFFKRTDNMEVSKVVVINPEKSLNTEKNDETQMKRKVDTIHSVKKNKTQKGTDSKFIFKNKRAKRSESHPIMQENLELKNEILMLQKNVLLQEVESKSEITKLTIENLKLDTEIKRLTLQKLEANVINDYN